MKKVVVALIVVLVLLGLVGPKFAGNSFNSQLGVFAQGINDQPFYKAEIQNREQGWFSSSADLVISFDASDSSTQDLQTIEMMSFSFTVPVNAQHGPILTQSGFNLGWIDWRADIALSEEVAGLTIANNEKFVYSASGIFGLFGGNAYEDFMPALTYVDADTGMTVNSTEWKGNGYLTANSMTYNTVKAISLELLSGEVAIANIKDISFDMDIQEGLLKIWEQQLYNGTGAFKIASIDYTNPMSGEAGKLDSVTMDFVSTYDDSTELGNVLISTKTTKFENSTLTLDNLVFDYEINYLQRGFMQAYQNMSEDIISTPENAEAIMNDFMQDALLGQLKVEPEINFPVIKAQINESSLEGFMNAKLQGVEALPDTLEDPAFWAQHALVDAKLNIEQDAAIFIAGIVLEQQLAANPQFAEMSEDELAQIVSQQAGATVTALVQQGLLTEIDNGYEFTFSMENAQALLNGNPMPLPY